MPRSTTTVLLDRMRASTTGVSVAETTNAGRPSGRGWAAFSRTPGPMRALRTSCSSTGSHKKTEHRPQWTTAGTVSARIWHTSSVVPTRERAREKSSRARAVSLEVRESASAVTRSRAVAAYVA